MRLVRYTVVIALASAPGIAAAQAAVHTPEQAAQLHGEMHAWAEALRTRVASLRSRGHLSAQDAERLHAWIARFSETFAAAYADLELTVEEADTLRSGIEALAGALPPEAPPPAPVAPAPIASPAAPSPGPASTGPPPDVLGADEAAQVHAQLRARIEHFYRAVAWAQSGDKISEETAAECNRWISVFADRVARAMADGWLTRWEARDLAEDGDLLRQRLRGVPPRPVSDRAVIAGAGIVVAVVTLLSLIGR